MTRYFFIFLLALTPFLVTPWSGLAQSGKANTVPPQLQLLSSNENGIVLELRTSEYDITAESLPTGNFDRLTIPNSNLSSKPGWPQLPLVGAMVGIPPDVQVELRILYDDATTLAIRPTLPPAPKPIPLIDGDLQAGELSYEPDRVAYASNAVYPVSPARIADDAWMRNQRILRIELFPFQYTPAQKTVLWHRSIRVELRFVGKKGGLSTQQKCNGCPTDNAFDPIFKSSLLNYDSSRAWRTLPAVKQATTPLSSQATTTKYKIVTDHDGIYRITYAELQAAGMNVATINPRNFGMTNQGRDVSINVSGESDGSFDPGDSVIFYGQKFRGDFLAQKYITEADQWCVYNNIGRCVLLGGRKAQFNTIMLEKYTNDNVYWLTAGSTPGLRMSIVDGNPSGSSATTPISYTTTVRREESHEWRTTHFTSEESWFWDRVKSTNGPGNPVTSTYTITLTSIASAPVSATIRAALMSLRSSNAPNDHHTRFLINNWPDPVDDASWDGKAAYTFTTQISQTALQEGQNNLIFTMMNDGGLSTDEINFDWFEIEYARLFQADNNKINFSMNSNGTVPYKYEVGGFVSNTVEILDITEPLTPQLVINSVVAGTGGIYTATFQYTQTNRAEFVAAGTSGIQTPKSVSSYTPPNFTNEADYIFITHNAFSSTIKKLADYRASQGLSTMIVDVDDLYNEFNYGIYNPIAIKNFLAYSFANWSKPPTYALLVGGGHWNFKGYTSNPNSRYDYSPNTPIYMPPYLAWVDPWQGEVDSSNLLATVVGTDIIPDVLIGRVPVTNTTDLNIIINKIIGYEQLNGQAQDWQSHVMFVADNIPDSAGDFQQLSENIINKLPSSFTADRIYENDYGCTTKGSAECKNVTATITNTLNYTGALFVNYIGHASINRWAGESTLMNEHVSSLTNANQLPVLLSMTCLDGYWSHPSPTLTSLAMEMVKKENGGVVSSFSPTGLGVATGHDALHRGFYDSIFQDGVRTLGAATQAGKQALFASGYNYDLIQTFTIFGDPALRLNIPPPSFSAIKTANPPNGTKIGVNERITYTIIVTNSGELPSSFVLTDTTPTNTTYVTGSATVLGGATVASENPLVITTTNFTKNQILTITLIVTATGYGSISNQATFAGYQSSLQHSNIVSHSLKTISNTVPSTGGTLTFAPFVTITIASGTFSETVVISYTTQPVTSTGTLSNAGIFYTINAYNLSNGQPAQPSQNYTTTITYQQSDIPSGTDEANLALYYWNGSEWIKEPSSVVNTATNSITATPNQFGLWAILSGSSNAQSNNSYLPVIINDNQSNARRD